MALDVLRETMRDVLRLLKEQISIRDADAAFLAQTLPPDKL